MSEGLKTRIGWIVLSEFVVLVPKLRLGKENDKSVARVLVDMPELEGYNLHHYITRVF